MRPATAQLTQQQEMATYREENLLLKRLTALSCLCNSFLHCVKEPKSAKKLVGLDTSLIVLLYYCFIVTIVNNNVQMITTLYVNDIM